MKKLVRDKIPDKIRSNGENPITRVLNLEEYRLELFKKLKEECLEVTDYQTKEELLEECADVLEVLFAIAQVEQINWEEVKQKRQEKKEIRGGFEQRIYLEKVE